MKNDLEAIFVELKAEWRHAKLMYLWSEAVIAGLAMELLFWVWK